MTEQCKVGVTERGYCRIRTVNGERATAERIGPFAEGLYEGDIVELADGEVWTVSHIGSYIQTGASGSANHVVVKLERD